MESKDVIPSIKVSIKDIIKFLENELNLSKAKINESIYVSMYGNQKGGYDFKIGDHFNRECIIFSNVNSLDISFYSKDKSGNKIEYPMLTLQLDRTNGGKLYFSYDNRSRDANIQIIEGKEKVEKKDCNNEIYFGNRIDYLIYTISKNNEKFINLNDAQNSFEFLFCRRDSEGCHVGQKWSYNINKDYNVLYQYKSTTETEKIDECKIFIRHENYENTLNRCNESSGAIDINELREKGYVEIDLKKNNDETGFKYKLIDCNGNLISYAVDDPPKSEKYLRLKCYLNDKDESGKLENFVEGFNLGLNNSEVVLSGKAQGFCFTDRDVDGRNLVCLGPKTKLVFAAEFLNRLVCKSNNKFYVLLTSQACKDILNFIAETGLLPCEELCFINKKIVKSYDIEKHISDNINGKDLPKLCIDDLTKVSKIADNFECVLEVFKKIKKSSSDFKTDDINEILTQVAETRKKKKEKYRSSLKSTVERLLVFSLSRPNNNGVQRVYESMKKELEKIENKTKTRYKGESPNQESQVNYENTNIK